MNVVTMIPPHAVVVAIKGWGDIKYLFENLKKSNEEEPQQSSIGLFDK